MSNRKRTLQFLLLTLSVCVLSACDGGLFGTGDGQTTVVDTANSNSESSGNESNSPADTNDANTTTQAFDNLLIGTTTSTPLLNVINVSNQAILVASETNRIDLFQIPIAANMSTRTARLQLGENQLTISDPDTSEQLLNIRPLNVGTSTLTTVIVANNTSQLLDVVILSSRSTSLTPMVAQLRLVQADRLDSDDTVATFSLQPSGDSPGSTDIDFPGISTASASSADYRPVSPGSYRLLDSLKRIDVESLNLRAGKIYTLIITSNPDSAIVLHEDDLLGPE